MIDARHELPVSRQAELLDLARSTVYYRAQPTSAGDLTLMRRIDELHLDHPFAGARMLRDMLRREGHQVGRKHVSSLMRKMGIEAIYRRRNTSKRHPAHRIYPYLLRGLTIERANHAWAMDITYLPMKRGFVYLAVVLDWASRRILAWRLSNSLTADFCIEALEEALRRHGKPTIMNTDQGSQFTCAEFIATLNEHGIAISMDGKGCWRDNVFVERLWKTIKYEEVYLRAYESVSEAKASLTWYVNFYNARRPHRRLDGNTPDTVYFESLPLSAAA
jgi:putative transposase